MKKRQIIVVFLLIFCSSVFAQEKYQYVIIPTHFPEISSGLNPYGISSSLQKILNNKSIKSLFEQNEIPDDYCKALTAHIKKIPNMFRSKIKIEFKDCRNQTIWSAEGTGISKSFREGYAEALDAALKDFEELPANQSLQYESSARVITRPESPAVMPGKTVEPVAEKIAVAKPAQNRIYKPSNLYYNYNYFVDMIENDNGNKELMIINGELLGYQNLDIIATLTSSGLENVYTVEWKKTNNRKLTGVANLISDELKISLKEGDEKFVIILKKY